MMTDWNLSIRRAGFRHYRPSGWLICVFIALSMIVACKSAPSIDKTNIVELRLIAGPNMNLNSRGVASPLKVSIYALTNVEAFLDAGYPWCFALVLRGRFYLGAFLDGSDTPLFALISRLSRDGALHQAALRQSLAFWQARILCLRADERPRAGESAAVQRWVQALRLSFAPAWVRWWVNQAWRFGPRSSALLTELCAADYRLGPNAGVDAVPWREWPACIAQGNHIWIWRQSRHGKYIDAQRIAITQQGSSGKNAAA
ncbi:type VI secretion system lipoprotein TssJ [Cronobacter malonaticus]|uniref:type VI secretion system lipoprotein TssJ n=1 Tax=Cronobacter malonaticus TaxID=413503 RepID=UPI0018F88215|nr:type VI secretion system lipoprotein TssJ [Cronobacter malonaticus]